MPHLSCLFDKLSLMRQHAPISSLILQQARLDRPREAEPPSRAILETFLLEHRPSPRDSAGSWCKA